jgi:hypothetical protein
MTPHDSIGQNTAPEVPSITLSHNSGMGANRTYDSAS